MLFKWYRYAPSADGSVCLSLTDMCVSAAAFVGQGMGVAAWLVEAHIEFGELSTTTLQQIGPALTGGCFSLFISLILTIVLSFIFPQNFDWNDMKSISVFNDISKDVSFPSTVLSSNGIAPSLHVLAPFSSTHDVMQDITGDDVCCLLYSGLQCCM